MNWPAAFHSISYSYFPPENKSMAGRPRLMAKLVARILERHEKLTEELSDLGKHHMPAEGERWDLAMPGGDVDPIPALWRTAVLEASNVDDYIADLLCFLELKVEEAETAKSHEADAPDDLDADSGNIEPGAGETAPS
jgi:hypothetical protein